MLEEVLLKQEVTLTMPKQFSEKVKYLCNKIHDVEWSGVLFYSLNGSIKDPKNLEIILQDILPLDKGSKTYTSYDLDDRYVTYLMDNPEVMEWQVGHIHSHNTMSVFFSLTDQEELHENAENHNMYLSLIVNNRMEFKAKIGTIGIVSQSVVYSLNDEKGEEYSVARRSEEHKRLIFIYDCVINTEVDLNTVPESFMDKVKALFIKPKPVIAPTRQFPKEGHQFGMFSNRPANDLVSPILDDNEEADNEEEDIVFNILSQVCVGYVFEDLEDLLEHMDKRGIYGNTTILHAFQEQLPGEMNDLEDTQENLEIILGNVGWLVNSYAETFPFLSKTDEWLESIIKEKENEGSI